MDDLIEKLRADAKWQRRMKGGATNDQLLDRSADAIEGLRLALSMIADGLPNERAPHRFSMARDIARLALDLA